MALRGYWLFPFRAARLDMNGSFVILKPATEFCQAKRVGYILRYQRPLRDPGAPMPHRRCFSGRRQSLWFEPYALTPLSASLS
jgi:hypothetical protein